jgi:hypothetical protein
MRTKSLQQLTTAELEELLMDETKKFTSAFHDGTSQEQKDIMRKRIDDIIRLIEKIKQENADENTTPDLR